MSDILLDSPPPKGRALRWRVHVAKLLAEIMVNPACNTMKQPLLIFYDLLRAVDKRAIELDDPQLNRLMVQLTLYSVADPASADHDPNLVAELLYGE